MVTTENYDATGKHVYFKIYNHLDLLEKALECLENQGFIGPQISILGKVEQFYRDKNIAISKNENSLPLYWKDKLHKATPFGSLYNPEIGNIFFVGSLTSIFLNKVDGKTLGMLSVGPHAILRGIGASEKQATNYLKHLKSSNYLLIVRGYEYELKNYKEFLDDKVIL